LNSVKIHFLNVGHGDCTIIEHESGRLTMIDINNSKSLPEEDIEALAQSHRVSIYSFKAAGLTRSWEDYYKSLLVDPREYWEQHFWGTPLFRYVQSHPDMDHMGGLASLFWGAQVELGNFWDVDHGKTFTEADFDDTSHDWNDWRAYMRLRDGHGPNGSTHRVLKKQLGYTGDYWSADGLTILSPTVDLVDYCDRIESWNNASYVFRFDYGGRRVIFPGDAEKPAWDSIEANFDSDELRCDILKAAHHGRESGYSKSAVDAEIVICSVGKKPETDASDEYASHGARVHSTRYNGTITCQIWADGETWVTNHKGERIDALPIL
jgi:beta-lactamase superfamily II metal-dependent hydrolase